MVSLLHPGTLRTDTPHAGVFQNLSLMPKVTGPEILAGNLIKEASEIDRIECRVLDKSSLEIPNQLQSFTTPGSIRQRGQLAKGNHFSKSVLLG